MNETMHERGKGQQKTQPALDFQANSAQVGIYDFNQRGWIVDSSGQQHSMDELQKRESFIVAPYFYDGVVGRWEEGNLQDFVTKPEGPTFGAVLHEMMGLIDHYLDLQRPQESGLVACWVVGTYFFPLFSAFPRLSFHGKRETGKSKLSQLIARLAFNGLHRISPTPATLFRLIGPLRPTFCLDEMEKLGKADQQDILSIINAGYKDRGVVDRTEGDANNRRVVSFPVYTPMVLAGITGVNGTTADRAITVNTRRGKDKDKLNRELPLMSEDAICPRLRAGCYRLALTQFRAVRQTRQELKLPDWLVA